MTEETPKRSAAIVLFGRIVAIGGIVWMVLSGLCGATFLIPTLTNGFGAKGASDVIGLVIMVLTISGISALIGLGVWAIGRAISGK